jgi:hypothetical protein
MAKWPPAFATQMGRPFLGVRWPKGGICHDSGAGVMPANGRTSMEEVTTLEDEHIPWRACKSAVIAICLQNFAASLVNMIMARVTSFLLELELVAVGPNIEGSG